VNATARSLHGPNSHSPGSAPLRAPRRQCLPRRV
jgi:hypothetical protein